MKKAIALIELVFAIVIIAITLISVPNLIAVTTKASNSAITQEAISNSASHTNMILSQFWDENDTSPTYNNPILAVADGFSELSEAKDDKGYTLGRRVGSKLSTSRRFAVDISGNKLSASSSLKKEEAANIDYDDVDDYNNITNTLFETSEHTTAEQGDYKDKNVQIKTTINYISDKPTNGSPATFNNTQVSFDNPFSSSKRKSKSTNIKSIIVTLKSTNDPSKRVVLKGFSCNIGSSKLKEKKF